MWAESSEEASNITVPENPTPNNIARLILQDSSIIASVAFQVGQNRALKVFRWWEEIDILTPEMAKKVDRILREAVAGIGLTHTTVGWQGPTRSEYVLEWIHGHAEFDENKLSHQLA